MHSQQKVNTLTKSIKEKENLIKISLALGMEPDPKLVKEVSEYRDLLKNIKTVGSEFNDFISSVKQLKTEPIIEEKKPIELPKPPTVEELLLEFEVKEEPKKEVLTEVPLDVPKPPTVEELLSTLNIIEDEEEFENTLVNLAAKQIEKEAKLEEKSTFAQPDVPIENTINDLKKKVKLLEDWLAKVSATGPGSGEVNLLRLDDVDISGLADNKFLKYNAANKKIEFATVSGSGESVDLSNVNSNIIPSIDSVFNIGSSNKRFKDLFLSGNTIDLGGTTIGVGESGQIAINGEKVCLVDVTGAVVNSVPFFTQELGLNIIAANFKFGPNPDVFAFSNFTLSDGTDLQQTSVAQFYF